MAQSAHLGSEDIRWRVCPVRPLALPLGTDVATDGEAPISRLWEMDRREGVGEGEPPGRRRHADPAR